MSISILIADDHSMVREGLRTFLGLDPDLQLVGEAANGEEAVELAHSLKPNVVLMDLKMPGMDGIAATVAIRRDLPDTEVIALTSILEDATIFSALRAGAIGYLLKDTEADELCRAIKAAAGGQVQLSPQVAKRLVHQVSAPETGSQPLTARETQVLGLLARGYSNKDLMKTLGISEKTAKAHVSAVLKKLGMLSRTQAALYAVRAGLVPPDSLGQHS